MPPKTTAEAGLGWASLAAWDGVGVVLGDSNRAGGGLGSRVWRRLGIKPGSAGVGGDALGHTPGLGAAQQAGQCSQWQQPCPTAAIWASQAGLGMVRTSSQRSWSCAVAVGARRAKAGSGWGPAQQESWPGTVSVVAQQQHSSDRDLG